jgi:aspartate aminotransferase
VAIAQILSKTQSAKLSERAANAAPSPTLTIAAQVTALKAAGKDVIGFTAGEPDFDTPTNVKDAAKLALDRGQTKYTASSGTVELKNAIIAKHLRDNNLTYKPNQIIVSAGAKHSIYNLMQAILGPGDEVIIPAPYWVSYPEQVMLAGATPVIVQSDERFIATASTLEKHITPRTKLIVVNSPSNPTGAVYSPQELLDIADLAVKHGIYVMSDEIYEKIIYGSEFVSIASFNDDIYKLTLTVNGLSKSHAMTGWRIGWLAGDPEIVAAMGRIQDQSTSNPTSITQAASVEALNGQQESTEMMRKAFHERRDLIVGLLNAIPGIECQTPGGAFYVFPKVSGLFGKKWTHPESGETKTINCSAGFYEYLLTTSLVAVVPGDGFGADNYVRLSYATSPKLIQDGVARIADAVKRLD